MTALAVLPLADPRVYAGTANGTIHAGDPVNGWAPVQSNLDCPVTALYPTGNHVLASACQQVVDCVDDSQMVPARDTQACTTVTAQNGIDAFGAFLERFFGLVGYSADTGDSLTSSLSETALAAAKRRDALLTGGVRAEETPAAQQRSALQNGLGTHSATTIQSRVVNILGNGGLNADIVHGPNSPSQNIGVIGTQRISANGFETGYR